MKICYLVLVYNNIKDTIETLNSILEQNIKLDILVIDNNSNNECKNAVESYCTKHENIKYIYRNVNDGYAGGNNYGWYLLRKEYDFVFVVNNDIIIYNSNLTEKLVSLLQEDDTFAIAGPRVLVENNEDFPEPRLNELFFYKLQKRKYKNTDKYEERHAIIGCFLAIKTAAINEDYLFDESLFMYGEELDLCLRIWKDGKRVVRIKDSNCSIYHKGGFSSYSKGKPWIYYLSIRNALLSARNIKVSLRLVYLILYYCSFKIQLKRIPSKSDEAKALRNGFKHGVSFVIHNSKKDDILMDSKQAISTYKKKIAIISMHPAPYRNPVYEKLQKTMNVDIFYLYSKDNGHKEWNYKQEAVNLKVKHFPIIKDVHFGLSKIIKSYNTILIPAWYPISLLFIMKKALKNHKSVVFSCDTIDCKNDLFHRYIFNLLKKCSAFFVPGNSTAKFLNEVLEIPNNILFQGSYMIDESKWYMDVQKFRKNREQLRNSFGIKKKDFILLFVGKFVKNRDIPLLLSSIKQIREYYKNIKCLIIGDGDFYKDELMSYMNTDVDGIIYKQQVSYDELSLYYSISDVYIHPGNEPYSLATVQGVIAELPVISYKDVGCLADYVTNGKNGFVIEEKDPLEFTQKIKEIYENYAFFKNNSKESSQFFRNNRNIDFAVEQLKIALSK